LGNEPYEKRNVSKMGRRLEGKGEKGASRAEKAGLGAGKKRLRQKTTWGGDDPLRRRRERQGADC